MRVALATALTLAMLSSAFARRQGYRRRHRRHRRDAIRILSIDTPETFRSRCENEYQLGLKAKDRLTELLTNAEVSYTPDGVDRFGRWLATVYAGDLDVGKKLLKEGLALPYVPGPEAKAKRLATWCPTGK